MASEATMEAAARESRANVREDAVTITSGAKEKVDRTLASAQGLAQKIAHPMDAEARKLADERAELRKAQASAKQAAIRQMVHQEAENERFAARSQVAQLIYQGHGGNRYSPPPVQLPPAPPPPAGADSTSATVTEVPQPVEAPPVHTGMVGLGNCTDSDSYSPPVPRPVPHPLPPPPQLLDSVAVTDTAHVAADINTSTSANEVPAQPNPSRDVSANNGIEK